MSPLLSQVADMTSLTLRRIVAELILRVVILVEQGSGQFGSVPIQDVLTNYNGRPILSIISSIMGTYIALWLYLTDDYLNGASEGTWPYKGQII